jgi:hypothetical protein
MGLEKSEIENHKSQISSLAHLPNLASPATGAVQTRDRRRLVPVAEMGQ